MRVPGAPVARLRAARRRLRARGDAVRCPLCERSFAAFEPYDGRPGAVCPNCESGERHRLLWHWLTDPAHPDRLAPGTKLLVFGPDDATDRRLRAVEGLDYLSTDVDASQAMLAADITALPFADASFDAIICSHVLEHVVDERAAVGELARVVRPDGWVVVMCPVDLSVAATIEDPAVTTGEQRLERYGHDDHKRLYGADFGDRLRAGGLDVGVEDVLATLEEATIAREGLRRHDRFGPDQLYVWPSPS